MERERTILSAPKRTPAWVFSFVFHACAIGAFAFLMPVILYHHESFGPPVQVVQRVEQEERVLPRWKPEVEMPMTPQIEVVEEVVQEVEAQDETQPLWADVLISEAGSMSVDRSYPICAVGLRTRPRAQSPVAVPTKAAAPAVPSYAVPAVPVRPSFGVARQGGPSRTARVLSGLDPCFPERQRVAGRSATVLLLVHIDESGRPADVELLSDDVHPDFAKAALAAARKARYEPALAEGKPVSSALRVRIQFQLQ